MGTLNPNAHPTIKAIAAHGRAVSGMQSVPVEVIEVETIKPKAEDMHPLVEWGLPSEIVEVLVAGGISTPELLVDWYNSEDRVKIKGIGKSKMAEIDNFMVEPVVEDEVVVSE